MRLNGKVAVITGGAAGIGKGIVTTFAREGAKVIFLDIQEEKGFALEKAIRDAGGEATFIRTDVTAWSETENAVKKTVEKYGRIDVLVNNAGGGGFFWLHEMDDENDFDFTFNLNIKSYFRMCKLVIPHMLQNNGGSIVNIASVGGITGMPKQSAYGATKAAEIEFTRTVAVEYATRNIRCNAICPGAIRTELVPPGSEIEEKILSIVPVKRMGTPEEIASAAVFFASDECLHCNGASLAVDGGITCGPCIPNE
ncbi:MAG TPA: SDR family NAD(P)-dependent oxidoreductase [Bacillota bacterium]|nr:SDR family NAD(P)-dependent oxidoreductase [Bacillota bacterium]